MRHSFERIIQVRLDCTGELVDEQEVEFVNIEEDFFGADMLTFKCPVCGENHKSNRYGR